MGAYAREEIEAIYRRQFKLVYQICLVLMKSVPDAEDAAQTVFRRVLERAEPFRDQLRHWWRRCREDASAMEALAWEQPEDSSIWEQVAALPDKHRLVLFLHYCQGYATGEIAKMLGENPSTVRSRLVQARKKLKIRLEAEGYGTT